MIVDLLRNDRIRVCEAGSIEVPQLCVVELRNRAASGLGDSREAANWQHNEVVGQSRSDRGGFYSRSITGAPKVARWRWLPSWSRSGCRSACFTVASTAFDSSILIRTLVSRGGLVQCSAGGGIVAQSDPLAEYEETLHKAEGMLRALDRSPEGGSSSRSSSRRRR